MLSNASILKEKGLHNRGNKLLHKAKKLAIECENFNILLEIYDLILPELSRKEGLKIIHEKGRVLKKLENLLAYREINFDMNFGKTKVARQKSAKQRLKLPLLQKEELALSTRAKGLFHHIKSVCFFLIDDPKKSLEHLVKRKNHLDSSPEFLKVNLSSYFSCINNSMVTYTSLEQYEKVNGLLDELSLKLDDKRSFTPNIRSKIFRIYVIEKLDLLIKFGHFKEAIPFLSKIEQRIDQYKNQLSVFRLSIIYTNISIIYFGLNNYKTALTWINKALDLPKGFDEIDFIVFTKLFNIIIHYELGNNELVLHLERSFNRYNKQIGRTFEAEIVLIKFFRITIPKIDNNEEKIAAFKKLKSELIEIFKAPQETKLLNYFDFISWIESKMQNRSFGEIIKEKLANNSKKN